MGFLRNQRDYREITGAPGFLFVSASVQSKRVFNKFFFVKPTSLVQMSKKKCVRSTQKNLVPVQKNYNTCF